MSHIFIGIKVPESIGTTLYEWSEKYQKDIPLKIWTHLNDLHITLAFLGDADQGNYTLLKDSLSIIPETTQKFSLQITGTGIFGNPKTPRVLWAGVKKEERLFELQKKVYNACIQAGYQLDKRPYKPHITLGKKWNGTGNLDYDWEHDRNGPEDNLAWEVEDFVIFEIYPQRTPKYLPIERFLLK